MKKKITALALTSALILSLTACGSNAANSVAALGAANSLNASATGSETATASTEVKETLVATSNELKSTATTITATATEAVATAEAAIEAAENDQEDITYVTLSGSTATSEGSGKVKVDEDGTVKLKTAGTYVISGELNGQLIANVDDGDVTLILNGVTITSETSAALYVKNVTNCTILLAEGTENVLTDANEYVYELDDDGTLEDDPNACIHVKGNLVIGGSGSLTVNANQSDGIKSKLTMTIISGDITINAAEDAIQCNTDLVIAGGEFDITSGGGTAAAKTQSSGMNFGFNRTTTTTTEEEDEISTKGIKGETSVTITGGNINVNACDDAIHSNGTVAVYGGTMTLATGDDGIHADTSVIIEDGDITVTKSYEGIEATDIAINGGNINITASDDGLNAADGSGTETMGMFGGMKGITAQTYDFSITINGGYLYVNAGGDGLDSNGTLEISGGEVYVDGPVNDGNTALDTTAAAVINGGTLVAVGSSGMLETPSNGSAQNVLIVMFNGTQSAGTTITVKDSNGNTVASHTLAKTAACAIISADEFETNGTYTVSVGNSSFEVTLSSTVTTVSGDGTATTAGGFGQMGQMGGQMGGFGNFGGRGGRTNSSTTDGTTENSGNTWQQGQMPQMGEMPEMNGEFSGQMPQMGQMPGMNGQMGGFGGRMNGQMPQMNGGMNGRIGGYITDDES